MRQRAYRERLHALTQHYDQEGGGHGTLAAQVVLLSVRIDALAAHLRTNQHDYNSRRGLLRLVGRRNRILASLAKNAPAAYTALCTQLGLQTGPLFNSDDERT